MFFTITLSLFCCSRFLNNSSLLLSCVKERIIQVADDSDSQELAVKRKHRRGSATVYHFVVMDRVSTFSEKCMSSGSNFATKLRCVLPFLVICQTFRSLSKCTASSIIPTSFLSRHSWLAL